MRLMTNIITSDFHILSSNCEVAHVPEAPGSWSLEIRGELQAHRETRSKSRCERRGSKFCDLYFQYQACAVMLCALIFLFVGVLIHGIDANWE